jgi:amino acid transporter
MYAARDAGTGSFVAWFAGALLMLVFCMCLSELTSLYPKRGLLASICSFSHNKDFSFIIGLSNWFGTVCVIPSEALATTRYLNWPHWSVLPLIVAYAVLNSWGAKFFSMLNSPLTVFKFIVPLLTIALLFTHHFNAHNFHAHDFTNYKGILTAIMAGGVIYAFNGMQMIVNFASEAKDPKRNIPIALFSALGIGLALYLALQAAFIGSANLNIDYQSPFVQLAVSLNLGLLVMLLKVDATLSPSGTGFMYMGTSSRMLKAMSREGQLPRGFNVLHPKYQVSHRSLFANTLLSLILFAVFRTWQSLVIVVSTFHVISYLAGPLAVGKLRLTMPKAERMFHVPYYWVICPTLFIALSILFVEAGSQNDLSVTVICCAFLALYLVLNYKGLDLVRALNRAAFIPIWLIVLTAFSQMGGGHLGEVAVVALFLYYVGVGRQELSPKNTITQS